MNLIGRCLHVLKEFERKPYILWIQANCNRANANTRFGFSLDLMISARMDGGKYRRVNILYLLSSIIFRHCKSTEARSLGRKRFSFRDSIEALEEKINKLWDA